MGFSPDNVYITASPNFITLITKHSVIAFLPQFLLWGILLTRYDFSPRWVFLLYGITGFLNELLTFGIGSNAVSIGYWIIIYGLILYLPAYIIPRKDNLKKPVFYQYSIMIILPILVTVPWYFIIRNFI